MRTNTLKIHLDVLDKKRQVLLKKLVSIDEKFVLSGGTALAMQLKHRKSHDFDFFSPEVIAKKLLERLSIITSGGIKLKQIIQLAQKVYGTLFNPKLFLQQLVYFGDILDFEIMLLPGQKTLSPQRIKKFFEKEVKGFLG